MSSPTPRPLPPRLLGALAVVGIVSAGVIAVGPAQAADGGIVINEVQSSGPDWIELANTSAEPVDVSGWIVKDDQDGRTDALPVGTIIAPGAYYVYSEPTMSFGLGKSDAARLFLADGATLVDSYGWTTPAATTYGRCADGVGAFAVTAASTPGAPNACTPGPTATPTPTASPTAAPPGAPLPGDGALVVNEVESNGDDTDWFELYNTTDAAIDVSGFIVRDDDDGKRYELPAGSVVPARGILLVDQATAHSTGFDFGLGSADQVRLFAPDGATLIAQAAWTTHAATSYGLCPDGVGSLRETTVPTKGAPNNCRLPLAINEVESKDGDDPDWIELVNFSGAAISAAGVVVTDAETATHRYTVPAGTTVPAHGYLVIDASTFGFGLGAPDAVHLFDTDGATELDATTWTTHAPTTWGRCTDATGVFGTTVAATKGTANRCPGETVVEAWPGGAGVTALDAEGAFAGDLSGLDVDGDGELWAVENGNGTLFRLDATTGAPAAGWEHGKTLRYPGGAGKVDAEGVTGLGGAVYVSSERNNENGKVSRPSVLRYDPGAAGDVLTADAEWNLSADFPGLGANAGLEGITWVPDAFLTARGFVDQSTRAAYDPTRYAGHGDGLFFVGVEGTAKVYAYALQPGGAFARVATIDTPFSLVADVQFDRGLLWVVCDEACNGRTATYEIDGAGAFAPTHVYARPAGAPDVANEGFAIGVDCTDGFARTFYADDADTDGFSLRSGTLACGAGETPPEPTPTPTATPTTEPTAPAATPTSTALPETTPGAPDPAALSDANRGGLVAPASVVAGGRVTLSVPGAEPGESVHGWIFSTPTDLGATTASATRTVTLTVPASVAPGAHRIVVTDAAGAVLGWAEITVTAPAALAATGGDAAVLAAAALAGLLLLAAGTGAVRRAATRRG